MTDKVLTEFFNSKNVTVDETVITDLVALENQYLNKISIESEQKGIKKAQADIQNQIADAKALAKKEAEQEFASKLQNEVTKVKQDSEKTVAERTLESKSAADAYQKQLEEIKAQLNVVKAQSDNIVGKNLILEKLGKVDDASYSDILKLTTQPIGTQEWLTEVTEINKKYNIIQTVVPVSGIVVPPASSNAGQNSGTKKDIDFVNEANGVSPFLQKLRNGNK